MMRWGKVVRATSTYAWVVLRNQAKPRRCEIWHTVGPSPTVTGAASAGTGHTHPVTAPTLQTGAEVLVVDVDWPPGRLAVIATR